jgi:hypothetical protein
MKKLMFYILFFFASVWLQERSLEASSYMINSSGVYLGARGSRVLWEQKDLKSSGYSIGPSAGLDYRKPSHVYGGFRFYWILGSLHDDLAKQGYKNLDMQGRLGYTFGDTFLMTPYGGLGLNIIKKKLMHPKEPCHTRYFKSVYTPVGVVMSYHPSSTFSVGIDYQFAPQIDSFSEVSGFKNIAFNLKKKGQHGIEIPIQFTYPQPRFGAFQYRIVPFYRTYAYGSSLISSDYSCSDQTFSIADNKVHEWGLRYEVAIW